MRTSTPTFRQDRTRVVPWKYLKYFRALGNISKNVQIFPKKLLDGDRSEEGPRISPGSQEPHSSGQLSDEEEMRNDCEPVIDLSETPSDDETI